MSERELSLEVEPAAANAGDKSPDKSAGDKFKTEQTMQRNMQQNRKIPDAKPEKRGNPNPCPDAEQPKPKPKSPRPKKIPKARVPLRHRETGCDSLLFADIQGLTVDELMDRYGEDIGAVAHIGDFEEVQVEEEGEGPSCVGAGAGSSSSAATAGQSSSSSSARPGAGEPPTRNRKRAREEPQTSTGASKTDPDPDADADADADNGHGHGRSRSRKRRKTGRPPELDAAELALMMDLKFGL